MFLGTTPQYAVCLILRLQSLQSKRVLSIDLSAIMAGSGVRGQFEEKFKALIRDIEDEVCPQHLPQRGTLKNQYL